NRAMWTAYNRFFDATDGYYPGGDGYVVRTAANVLRNGKNHIILGGSSDKGAAWAAERFIALIKGPELPWLLDVELGGECRSAFEANDKLWREARNGPLLPPIEPGYGTVRRWYQNAMAYYWSGWPGYWERAQQHLDLVLKDRAYTHQYPLEFFV